MFRAFSRESGGRRALLKRPAISGGPRSSTLRTGCPKKAARALLVRGDAEADPAKRFVFFTQAVALAPAGRPIALDAKKKRATLAILLAGDGPLTAAHRHDVIAAAARELEEAGDAEAAAAAYARAGDVDGQARALERGGSVEQLEALLDGQNCRGSARSVIGARARGTSSCSSQPAAAEKRSPPRTS